MAHLAYNQSKFYAAILATILATILYKKNWHFILLIRFKFEPNRFINGSVIANQSFEPPSSSPF